MLSRPALRGPEAALPSRRDPFFEVRSHPRALDPDQHKRSSRATYFKSVRTGGRPTETFKPKCLVLARPFWLISPPLALQRLRDHADRLS